MDKLFNKKILNKKILKSGFAGEIIEVKLEDGNEFIIKTYQNSEESLKNLEKEYQGLSFLSKQHYLVPKPYLLDTTNHLMVMEKINGLNLFDVPNRDGLIEKFVDSLYQLHQLNCDELNYLNWKDTEDFLNHELHEIEKDLVQYEFSDLIDYYNWLKENRKTITNEKLSFLHRDYHPWNVLVNEQNELYVIDWVCGLGDFRFDLAWTTTLLERSGFTNWSHSVYKLYQERKEINDYFYFEVLSTLRWLINVKASVKTGANVNENRKEEFNDFIKPLINSAYDLLNRINN